MGLGHTLTIKHELALFHDFEDRPEFEISDYEALGTALHTT